MMKSSDFNYKLPNTSIANSPAFPRDTAKLMLVNRNSKQISDHVFYDLTNFLTAEDVLVLNDSKVFPARLRGKKSTGGNVEILLIRPTGNHTWEAMSRGVKPLQIVQFNGGLTGQVLSKNNETGYISIKLEASGNIAELIEEVGTTPIPPYIHTSLSEVDLRQEYQNVYADQKGSAAAPTAGMHFTIDLLNQLEAKGIQIERVTLHVGPGTFAKLRPEQIKSKSLHHEWYSINEATADRLNQAKKAGKRIIAVGTTTCRVLESATLNTTLGTSCTSTSLFIMPPYKFKFVDALITNFHLPESSLLMLVSSLVSSPNTPQKFTTFSQSLMGEAYKHAVQHNYRFFSFGDAMFIC